MDDQMVHRLRDQAQSLRAVLWSFQQACDRAAGLGSGAGWLGPASAAYDSAIGALRMELHAAEAQLAAALRDTIRAIDVASLNAERGHDG